MHTSIAFPFSLSYPGIERERYFSLVRWFPGRKTLKFGEREYKTVEDSDEGLTLYLTIDRSKRTVHRSDSQKENSILFFCVSVCAIRKQHTFPCAVHVTSQTMSAFFYSCCSGAIGSRVCSVLPLISCVLVIPACRVCMNSSASHMAQKAVWNVYYYSESSLLLFVSLTLQHIFLSLVCL
jgi:hypothetical protein